MQEAAQSQSADKSKTQLDNLFSLRRAKLQSLFVAQQNIGKISKSSIQMPWVGDICNEIPFSLQGNHQFKQRFSYLQ